jgi:GTP-binding protein
MFKHLYFLKSVYSLNEIPKLRLPEVVLCGRSNVGKSSLINSLFNKKDLAKVSSTPGKTRSINYYSVDDKFYLVDLPGFGFAKVSQIERKKLNTLITDFLIKSSFISIVFHIIDCRHKPSENDIKLNKFLKKIKLSYIFILNKSDKIRKSEQRNIMEEFIKIFPEADFNTNTIFYSAFSGQGKREILTLFKDTFL